MSSFIEQLTERQFQTGADGTEIFYPFGKIGSGYIAPTGARRDALLARARGLNKIAIALIVVVGTVSGAVSSLLTSPTAIAIWATAVGVVTLALALMQARLASGLAKSRRPFDMSKAKPFPRWFAKLSLGCAAVMLLGSIAMALTAGGTKDLLIGGAGIVMFGLSTIVSIAMLRQTNRPNGTA